VSDAPTRALAIAAAVRARQLRARDVVESALQRIATVDPVVNSFTDVLGERARAEAERVDAAVAAGRNPGPLAGVPFAVKNLFDVAGIRTLAGSKIYRERPIAARDAAAVRALSRAGAVLVGALNMDEYACGFTTENTHYGPTHNPHDLARVAGGSSGGSGAALAAGLVPLTLGTDTNGSIRVPASLCGVFGLKPTYGRVSRVGAVLFAGSFDHVGPLARSVEDLAVAFDALQGPDPEDPVCSARPAEPVGPTLAQGVDGLRVAVAEGYFGQGAEPEALEAVATVAKALDATRALTFPEPQCARAAAMVITDAEGSQQHLELLRTRAADFDPLTRDRFLAGALVPAALVLRAQRFRAWYRARVRDLFAGVDVVVAPTTPCVAPLIGKTGAGVIGGMPVFVRTHLGVFTQPLSFIGLPVISVPVARPGQLPIGVQLVGAPWSEATLFRVAAALESAGVVAAPIATPSPAA
jgi:amidase/aspartyl-tRNA(Asn)/glutamyl-tRNA(Gln) amidotransferase subunit A